MLRPVDALAAPGRAHHTVTRHPPVTPPPDQQNDLPKAPNLYGLLGACTAAGPTHGHCDNRHQCYST